MKKEELISVAAYCRVSTDREEQVSSFANQVHFFEAYIAENPQWHLHQIYTDEGITGTSVKKREGFLRMIEDAKKGCFALILTKEISRFARNLLDSIFYTRELKKLGVGVIFLNDGIDTRDGDAELRLAILSSIAQEESRRTSERVKWGQKRRMEAGVVFGRGLLGYELADGVLSVNEAEAETVRRVFHLFAEENMGISMIARTLSAEGLRTKAGNFFTPSTLCRILQNEKYCGDLVQKKTVTVDYLSHEKKYNRGEEALIVLRDHHMPIVERELFERTQEILSSHKGEKRSGRESRRYPFSGKVVCGVCGARMTARVQARQKEVYHLWRCARGHETVSLRNDAILFMMQTVLQEEAETFHEAAGEAEMQIEGLISSRKNGARMAEAKEKLLTLYLAGEIEKEEFQAARMRLCEEEARMGMVKEEIRGLFSDERFYREMTQSITVFGDRAEVRLFGSVRSFSFVRAGSGRACAWMLHETRK